MLSTTLAVELPAHPRGEGAWTRSPDLDPIIPSLVKSGAAESKTSSTVEHWALSQEKRHFTPPQNFLEESVKCELLKLFTPAHARTERVLRFGKADTVLKSATLN